MARRSISLDSKIEAAEAEVAKQKEKLNKAMAELKALRAKKEAEDKAKLVDALVASNKSAEEILAFLKG